VKPLRLGFIPLTDCAVLAVAEARGFFRRHGVAVALSREPSWANIRDKLAAGALDGAQMLAGMPLACAAGIDPPAAPTVTAFSLGLNGNAIALSAELWARACAADHGAMAARPVTAAALRRVIQADRARGRPPLRFAMVYPFAMHHYELRYWLAAAGIDPDRDVRLSVVPPPRMVEALAAGTIDGFCVGEPWSSLAVQRGLACIAISTYELWNNSPEKVFAVPRRFAEREPALHQTLLHALLEAAAWADAHRDELAALLAESRYVGLPADLLAPSLTGRLALRPHHPPVAIPDFHVFHRYAANFPWVSHGMWLLGQMRRWGHITAAVDLRATAAAVYRPDLYRAAARAVGVPAPADDLKCEGTHATGWTLAGTGGTIAMGSDRFFDGGVFDPHDQPA
jgi:ABC-type nitrate/sulfonate/bicarbonate transport system substrate-binding protein